ncbi:MAG: hypothetical protein ACQEQH_05405 [Bacillota bacterium]
MAEDNHKQKDVICPLCGYDFKKEDSQKSCEGCPLNKNSCGLIRCPNCGYEFPEIDDTGLMDRIKRIFKSDNNENDQGGK